MKTLLATLAILVGLAASGSAMACGNGAKGKLARVTIKKTYRSADMAARNAAAGAMTKLVKGQDNSGPALGGRSMVSKKLAGSTKTRDTFRVTVKDSNDTYSGSAKVQVMKLGSRKFQATILSGNVSASW
jgi:hypothetical protein